MLGTWIQELTSYVKANGANDGRSSAAIALRIVTGNLSLCILDA